MEKPKNQNNFKAQHGDPRSRPRRRYQLSPRCLLIRNLPKGFVARSDLTDKNHPVRVQRVAYCEESHGSVMVEFASAIERNKILALDQQHQRRIRQRVQDQSEKEDMNSRIDDIVIKPYKFEIKVTIERCTSERFVRSVLSGASRSIFRNTNSASPSPQPSPSRLVNRCIVIRKLLHNAEEKDIPQAPPYDRNMFRSDDASIRSGDSLSLKSQQKQSSPMEIRSGNICEFVVRGVTLRNKSISVPAMLIELESAESVDRILLAEDAKQSSDSATPTTLAIPVELHPVKSERYAQLCFGNVSAFQKSVEKTSRRKTLGDDDTQTMHTGETTAVNKSDQFHLKREDSHEYGDVNHCVEKDVSAEQEIKDLRKEVGDLRSELGRWKARAQRVKTDLTQPLGGKNEKHENLSEAGGTAFPSDDQKSLFSTQSLTQSGLSEDENWQEEWGKGHKNSALEEQVRELLSENARLKAARSIEILPVDHNKTIESSHQLPVKEIESKISLENLLDENKMLKARILEIDQLKSELEDSKLQRQQAEQARNKLEDENSGLLRYVLELEGHRSGQALADEERHKELEKKHSDLSTLYRFVQAQAEQSAAELHKALAEKETLFNELHGFKSAWRTRMAAQRRLSGTIAKDDKHICADCETVEFYSAMEKAMDEVRVDSTFEVVNDGSASQSDPPVAYGTSQEHRQTTGQPDDSNTELLIA